MKNLNSLKEQIAKHEGYEPKVYKCTNGYDTIGYGFAIKDLYMDKEVADLILDQKINKLLKRISADEDWGDWFLEKPQAIQEVLINMIYQIGFSGVKRFRKTIQYIKDDNFLMAAEEMLDSKWARSDSPNRAKELSEIIKSQ
jgi:lysozyme